MGEYVNNSWKDLVTVDHRVSDLDRSEEALFLSAKSGSLFEPDMTPGEWKEFCEAAGDEERERKAKVPKEFSQLSDGQREVLKKGSESIKSEGVRKLIERREDLIKQLRPQCVDADDSVFEAELLEELGMTEEEFKNLDTRVGEITEKAWQELEELSSYKGPDINGED